MVNPKTLTPLLMYACVWDCFLCEMVYTPINAGYFYNALPHISTTSICHFGVALKQKCFIGSSERERERERERGFNGSLYAISNGLRFISHRDDFRPCNGAVPYLVYDQWQYISVLSFGTALLHLLVLAVEFSAVQFEQQRLLLQSFVVIFCCFFFCLLSLKCSCVEVFLIGLQVINER